MFVPRVAKQKSRANTLPPSTVVGLHGPDLSEHGDWHQEKAAAGGHGAGQALDFGKIPLFSPGSGDSSPVQAKLKVGAPNDSLEHEADNAADEALHIPEPDSSSGGVQAQRGAMRPRLRAEAAVKPLERNMSGPAPDSFPGRGAPLPAPVRGLFERQFQYSFGDVRVHDGPDAAESARGLGARAYTWGREVVFGAGEYLPGTARGTRLLGHELAHVVQQGSKPALVQRSPLSDQVKKDWDADPKLETLLARLGKADVQADKKDTDLDAMLKKELASKADDLWLAQRIRQGELGQTSGNLNLSKKDAKDRADAGYDAKPRPIKAFFFRGKTDKRALVIAGVHGTERQGMDVADRMIHDLQSGKQAAMSAIIVPSLFPDNAAAMSEADKDGSRTKGMREGDTPTNRNFPDPSQDLAGATDAKTGKAMDAMHRKILPENQLLMQLIEKFHPERIISIHGTQHTGAAGAFYDARKLSPEEDKAARDWAADTAAKQARSRPQDDEGAGQARLQAIQKSLYQQRVAELTTKASDADRDLSLKTAQSIDAATTGIKGREKRPMDREKEKSDVTATEKPGRLTHASIAGNVGSTGAVDHASWSGSTPGGTSLGDYAPARGISTFTVEPAVNANTDDYATKKGDVSQADRKVELQAYADAVRTILLGT